MLVDRAKLDGPVAALLQPVAPLLDRALEQLPSGPPLTVRFGDVPGFYALDGSELTLSSALQGPALSHPAEPVEAMPPIDRWRRAAGCVLEAVALAALGRLLRRRPKSDWRWVGAAIDLADRAAPDLELAHPDLAMAIRRGDPGTSPRQGIAAWRYWRHRGEDMDERAAHLLGGGVVSVTEWSAVGAWLLDPAGAGAALPVVVRHPDPLDVPARLPAWSWRPLRVPPHPRGGLVRVDGDGLVVEPWAVGGTELRTLAVAAEGGCALEPEPGGPVGRWELASAQGFGQVFGARGIAFEFRATGGLQVQLADAFVGPLAALAMAEEVGTSGVADGQWSVAGRQLLGFHGIASHGLTLHGRRGDGFLLPAGGFGLGEWLQALEEGPWGWQILDIDRLVMRGRMMGGAVEVRLKRVGD